MNHICNNALFSVAQIREIEQTVIRNGVSGFELMKKAGHAGFNLIKKNWPQNKIIYIYCGGGNNAGDGYVMANLALKEEYKIRLFALRSASNLSGDALIAAQTYIDNGGEIEPFESQSIQSDAIVVDALLGTGLCRAVSDEFLEVIQHINESATCAVLAVDIPSGVQADTGKVMGMAIRADVTLSFIAPKCGLYTGEAKAHCGRLVIDPIGIEQHIIQSYKPQAKIIEFDPPTPRKRDAHKGDFGHVLCIGGDEGYSGAIRMAAEAALRTGAGRVTVATREKHAQLINISRPEIMSQAVESSNELDVLLAKATHVIIGPGLGTGKWGQAMLDLVLAWHGHVVCDADALNLLALQDNNINKPKWIYTPHPGEAARLLKSSTQDIAQDRFTAITSLQQQYGGLVVLKGAGTLVKSSEQLFVCTTGNPGMATAGMGDILSGIIAGLMAQDMEILQAATQAVHIHGKAGDLVAAHQGERGMLAMDLLSFVRGLLNG